MPMSTRLFISGVRLMSRDASNEPSEASFDQKSASRTRFGHTDDLMCPDFDHLETSFMMF